MDEAALARAVELLGRFNDDMTQVVDAVFDTRWAEIEEILALVGLASDRVVSTRQLAEVSGLGRRAVSRLVVRLRSDGLVATRQSDTDRRVVEVVLTDRGDDRAALLRTSISDFFSSNRAIAREISQGMQVDVSPAQPDEPADALDLLRRVCIMGVSLVRFMPAAASEGKLAARQRAALVQVTTQGVVRPSDLVASLEVSPAGAAYIVDQLCSKGFVVRRRGVVPDDQRAVVLEATTAGTQAVLAVMEGITHQAKPLASLFAEVATWHRPVDSDSGPDSHRNGAPGSRSQSC